MPHSANIFGQIADAIAAKHLAQVKVLTAKAGSRPPFDDLMIQLRQMENELTKEGVQYIESCRGDKSVNVDMVTSDLKNIIRSTVESFVKQL